MNKHEMIRYIIWVNETSTNEILWIYSLYYYQLQEIQSIENYIIYKNSELLTPTLAKVRIYNQNSKIQNSNFKILGPKKGTPYPNSNNFLLYTLTLFKFLPSCTNSTQQEPSTITYNITCTSYDHHIIHRRGEGGREIHSISFVLVSFTHIIYLIISCLFIIIYYYISFIILVLITYYE